MRPAEHVYRDEERSTPDHQALMGATLAFRVSGVMPVDASNVVYWIQTQTSTFAS